MPNPDTNLYNINLETVDNCNLLCKLILDYMDTKECNIEKQNTDSFRIVYPEGSFINYRDTSYELTYAYFFYPSRHSIDGERYDLEVNIYHGRFKTTPYDNKGMVAHTHYHNDNDESNLHKHFHYHLNTDVITDDEKNPHNNPDTTHINKNIVTCLLFNKGKHSGSDVNIFFNQFIHTKKFKDVGETPADISVHDNWTIEQIYPKKRSFFMYDSVGSVTNTYVVFDTVQTISKEIIDRLYKRGIKGTGHDLTGGNFNPTNPGRVLYRKNIEVITDPAYKKSKRAQIKDLLSLTRMSSYIPMKRTSKEYNEMGEIIVESISGGTNTGYLTSQDKAKRVADMWESYAKDYPIERSLNELQPEDAQKIILSSEAAIKYKYVEIITDYYDNEYVGRYNQTSCPSLPQQPGPTNIIGAMKNKIEEEEESIELKDANIDTITIEGDDNDTQIDFGCLGNNRLDFFCYFFNKANIEQYLEAKRLIIKSFSQWMKDNASNLNTRRKSFFNIFWQDLYRSSWPEVTENYETFNKYSGLPGLTAEERQNKNLKALEEILILPPHHSTRPHLGERLGEDEYSSEADSEGDILSNIMALRFLFEDLDLEWQRENSCESGFYASRLPTLPTETPPDTDLTLQFIVNIKEMVKVDFQEKIILLVQPDTELRRTLSNEECQYWLSNEVHHEGELWKFWEKVNTVSKNEGILWNKLTPELKLKIGEGMFTYDAENKWKTHNQCRNPGNRAAGPWCYTKNPNKRWEYCQKPYYSNIFGKIVLMIAFIFLIVVAYFTVKTLYKNEYPMKFVSTITGGKLASSDSFSKTKTPTK